ncbi:MAG: hypothetical protein EBY39_08565 [Flavobacteriia bacterium]|nr:hypothetical protein [Flavobacteriia bacterium]
MAGKDFDLDPTGVFGANYAVYNASASMGTAPEAGIFIPLSSLVGKSVAPTDHELTVAEARADHRKVAWGVLEAYHTHMTSLVPDTDIDNFTVTRGALSFTSENSSRRTYTVSFQYGIGQMDLLGEQIG